MLAVAADHPLAGQPDVSIEDLADHRIGRLVLDAPTEFLDEFSPVRTPAGRRIPQLDLVVGEASELVFAIAQGRVVQPVTATFSETHRHPDVVFVPFRDLPPTKTALVWRSGNRDPGLRELLRIAHAELEVTTT